MKQLSTRKEIVTLTNASLINMGVQLAMPILLVRVLDQTSFGHYRLFWLLGNSVMLFAQLGVPNSLFYFLPRAGTLAEKKRYVDQTLLFVGSIAIAWVLITLPWSPFLPTKFDIIRSQDAVVPLFLFFLVVSSVIEVLPNADYRYKWQAHSMIILGILRVVIVSGTAFITHDIQKVYWAICSFLIIRFSILLFYYLRYYGLSLPTISIKSFWDQLRFAIPFGFAGTLYNMRIHAEKWVVALLFLPEQYAIFANASIVLPFINVVRQPISSVILPKMSASHAAGNVKKMLEFNMKANVVAAGILLPAISFLFTFAPQITTFLFTDLYSSTANILRIYLIGMACPVVEISTILLVYGQGVFVMKVGALILFFSAVSSFLGAMTFGLPGAALGSVFSVYIVNCFNFFRVASLTGVRIRDLQDWRSLLFILFASVLAAILISIVKFLPLSNVFVLLLIGGLAYCLLYMYLLVVFGYRWLIMFYLGRKKWQEI